MKEPKSFRARTAGFGQLLFILFGLFLAQFLPARGVIAQGNGKASAPKSTSEKAAAGKTNGANQTAGSSLPVVTQIDAAMLTNLLKREGDAPKPLLINFWATWCIPCREEFPDLVKIDRDYRGKIDFITVSLDDLAEIDRDVPKFLAEMRAEMPAYLLKTADEDAAIASVSKEWTGGLPFTILINPQGTSAYAKQGKFKPDVLRAEIEKLLD